MSRVIDRMPEPAAKLRTKVVIVSACRTGTMGLHSAMKILGYKPYHMKEVFTVGITHMKILQEVVLANHNHFLGIKRYDKADFDKWFADYDCVIEMGCFIGPDFIDAYLQDPAVKFILTERNPDKWVTSVDNTIGNILRTFGQFPVSIIKYFDAYLYNISYLGRLIYLSLSDGTMPDHPRSKEALRQNYVKYINMVKEKIPPERMLVVQLEDGLGWEQICPFLETPIPDVKYPRGNDPQEFENMAKGVVGPRMRGAMMKIALLAVPVIGVGAWFLTKRGASIHRLAAGLLA